MPEAQAPHIPSPAKNFATETIELIEKISQKNIDSKNYLLRSSSKWLIYRFAATVNSVKVVDALVSPRLASPQVRNAHIFVWHRANSRRAYVIPDAW